MINTNGSIISSSVQISSNPYTTTITDNSGYVWHDYTNSGTISTLTEEDVRRIFREELDRMFKKLYLKGMEDEK